MRSARKRLSRLRTKGITVAKGDAGENERKGEEEAAGPIDKDGRGTGRDGRATSFIRTFQLPGSDRRSSSSFVHTEMVRQAERKTHANANANANRAFSGGEMVSRAGAEPCN